MGRDPVITEPIETSKSPDRKEGRTLVLVENGAKISKSTNTLKMMTKEQTKKMLMADVLIAEVMISDRGL